MIIRANVNTSFVFSNLLPPVQFLNLHSLNEIKINKPLEDLPAIYDCLMTEF